MHHFDGISRSSVRSWSKRGNDDFNVKLVKADFNVKQENEDWISLNITRIPKDVYYSSEENLPLVLK